MWAGDCFAGFVGFDFIHRNFKALLLKLLDNLFITSVTTFAANGKTVKKFFIMYVDIVSEYMDFNTMVICRNFKTGNSCQSVFVFGSSFLEFIDSGNSVMVCEGDDNRAVFFCEF